ncbi:VanZ family protein [Clostridium grantii]|uniref:VanZ like family protein n=1 Tax=Clostridium grantii DSM 8605 TaxID=1121316 RepID=A0A1M5Y4E1_9CLOT|nr:VanZ family protein [Clostridium grantii]SHI06907.1 VanZ like family protein [Clostridium grantii DSM 8605]
MKTKTKQTIKITSLLVWMSVIFIFSHQPASVSSENNKLVIYIFNYMGIDLNSIFGDITNFIIRKTAHITEYLILYILIIRVLKISNNDKGQYIKALVYVFLYASSDEIHQIFVENRGPSVKDVLIDTCGGILGMIIYYINDRKNILKQKRQ